MIKPSENTVIYRGRRYSKDGRWFSWYEPCVVLEHSPKRIKVISQHFPDSPLYPGGEFWLNREALIKDGKCYHSRHGEYFYLEKPSQGDLFPSQDILNMPNALDMEAAELGWELQNLNDRQFMAYITALKEGRSLFNVLGL